MYFPNRDLEDICFEDNHIAEVLAEINKNFPSYFEKYLETEAGNRITEKDFENIADTLGGTRNFKSRKPIDKTGTLNRLFKEAIDDFEKDRQTYQEILDLEALAEYEADPSNFKNSVLKNTCPIIRSTLQNKKAKELDKYRAEFNQADPKDLLVVITNLANFADTYLKDFFCGLNYDDIHSFTEMGLSDLDEDDYTAYGVIGGGIKSHFLYKLCPSYFPNRSRESVWALWYLTNKKTFNCGQDSEFLMLNLDKNTTQQNYFYPYRLFAFYTYNIYLILKEAAKKYGVQVNEEYRYVYVNSFLSYVAGLYADDIEILKSASSEDGYGYY